MCSAHVVLGFCEIWYVAKMELEQFHFTQCKKGCGLQVCWTESQNNWQQRRLELFINHQWRRWFCLSLWLTVLYSLFPSFYTFTVSPAHFVSINVLLHIKGKRKKKLFPFFSLTPGLNTTSWVDFTPQWLTNPSLCCFSHNFVFLFVKVG